MSPRLFPPTISGRALINVGITFALPSSWDVYKRQAITQNIKDLLASREVENIFENSDFVLMLNQAQGDRAILAKQLNISPQQMKYVTHTEAGEGLIFYGNVVLPFVDHFPKDTELYRIMTTKPEEVSSLWTVSYTHLDVYKRQVLDCMQENTTKIRNIKQYMKAALFNAPSTIGSYYT